MITRTLAASAAFPEPYLGEIYDIDIAGPDNGSVMLVESTPSHFIFQTIQTPVAQTGTHPEYGAREFGFERNPDNTITFYTRRSPSVDRHRQATSSEVLLNE